MSEIESKLKEENEFIKELFNFNEGEAQLKHLKEKITNKQMVQIISFFYLNITQNAGQINRMFPKNLLNVFILISQTKLMKFNKKSKRKIFSNSLSFQKNFLLMKTKNKKKCFCFFKSMILMDLFLFFQRIQQLI